MEKYGHHCGQIGHKKNLIGYASTVDSVLENIEVIIVREVIEMVEVIDYEEFEKRWGTTGGRCISIPLSPEERAVWKEKGLFKHLKDELISMPDLTFTCGINDKGTCIYGFICHSPQQADRILSMVDKMKYGHKKVHLMACKPKRTPCWSAPAGTGIQCALF